MLQTLINQSTFLKEIGFLIMFSMMIRQAIILNSQNWVKSFSSSLTLILLPIITYSITKVISGNIALSLGLVGALSIVRFRNPVRSSFELSVLFLFISLGIAASASLKYLFLLGSTSLIVLLSASLLTLIYQKFTGRNFFDLSFSEGNYSGTLEIQTKQLYPELEYENTFITSFTNFETTAFDYRFASEKFSDLQELKAKVEQYDDIRTIKISQV